MEGLKRFLAEERAEAEAGLEKPAGWKDDSYLRGQIDAYQRVEDVVRQTDDVLGRFAAIWSNPQLAAEGPWTGLTCGEADALAALLAAVGSEAAAKVMLARHAEEDDEGDRHYLHRQGEMG